MARSSARSSRLDPALGCKAVLPPPEEKQDVKTAVEAARAKQGRAPAAG